MQHARQKLARGPWFICIAALLFVPTGVLGQANSDSSDSAETGSTKPSWQVVGDERPGRGEQCLVCNSRVYGHDVVEVRYKGRTFHVKAGQMFGEFEGDPDKFFQKLQARSVLFDEDGVAAAPMSTGWLWMGVYVLAGLIFGAICGYVAVGRALAPLPWFVAGLVGNIAALIVLFMAPKGDRTLLPAGVPAGLAKVPTTRAPVRCSACNGQNHPGAGECSHCGARLDPTVEPETQRL